MADEDLVFEVASCRDLASFTGIASSTAGALAVAAAAIRASTIEWIVLSFVGFVVASGVFGMSGRRRWLRGLEIDPPLPEPNIVRCGLRAVPLVWRFLAGGFGVASLYLLVYQIFARPTGQLDGSSRWILSAAGGYFLGIGLMFLLLYRAARLQEHHRHGRVLVLFDPIHGIGVDRPNQQFYVWMQKSE